MVYSQISSQWIHAASPVRSTIFNLKSLSDQHISPGITQSWWRPRKRCQAEEVRSETIILAIDVKRIARDGMSILRTRGGGRLRTAAIILRPLKTFPRRGCGGSRGVFLLLSGSLFLPTIPLDRWFGEDEFRLLDRGTQLAITPS
jgi:hypothetical protein